MGCISLFPANDTEQTIAAPGTDAVDEMIIATVHEGAACGPVGVTGEELNQQVSNERRKAHEGDCEQ